MTERHVPRPSRFGRCLLQGVVVGLALLVTVSAWASGFSAPVVGTARSGPATPDAASLWWSPAWMAWETQPQVLVGGQLLVGHLAHQRNRRARYQEEDSFVFSVPVPPEAIDPLRSGRSSWVRTNPVGLAPSGFVLVPLPTRRPATVGVGMHTPWAALVSWPDDGPQRWSVREATLLTPHVTAAAAWRPVDRVAIGGGVSLVLGWAELSRVQDFAALEDLGAALARPPVRQPNDFGPDAPPELRELAVLSRPISLHNMRAVGVSAHGSVAAEVTETLHVTAGVHLGSPLVFRGRFRLVMDDPFFTRDLASQGLQYDPLITGEASLRLRLPRQFSTGARWSPAPRWQVAGHFTLVQWSQVDVWDARVRSPQLAQPALGLPDTSRLVLERRWENAPHLEVLVEHEGERFSWLLGGGYHGPASPDATIDASSPDGHRLVGKAGIVLPVTRNADLHLDATLHHVLEREVRASTHDLGNGTWRMTLLSAGASFAWRFGEAGASQ